MILLILAGAKGYRYTNATSIDVECALSSIRLVIGDFHNTFYA